MASRCCLFAQVTVKRQVVKVAKKNYLKDMRPAQKNKPHKPACWSDYWQAFAAFLRRPKTIFDLKDRGRFVLFLLLVIILLQKVVEWLTS